MKSFFTAEFFRNNRKRLRVQTNTPVIVITANGLMQRSGDTTYPFRQDSSFWYLTGIDDPDIILVIDQDEEYLIVPDRDPVREAFDGQLHGDAMTTASGITQILSTKDGKAKLLGRVKKIRKVATLAPPTSFIDFHGFYTNPARARLVRQLKRAGSKLEIEDLRMALARMRMRKQLPELQSLQSAIDITLETLNDLSRNNFKEYQHEYELEAALTQGVRKRGASGFAFAPIIASGEHACQIHHTKNNGSIIKNAQVLFDVGAEVSNYSADISRTYFVGTPTTRFKQVYQAVQDVYNFALSQLKSGINVRDYEKLVEQRMGKELMQLGLISSMDRKAIRHYYPHPTSHFLGLDTHDAGDYSEPLEPNMVLTVEPGIYIPEERIGIRIEDDVLITKNGNKVLSATLPKND